MSCHPRPLATLAQWQEAFAQPRDTLRQSLLGLALHQRYASSPPSPSADEALLDERLDCYADLIASLPSHGFIPSLPLSLVASPGRDRLFMGHTDMAGLGGFTLDCATREEMLCAAQVVPMPATVDEENGNEREEPRVYLINADAASFPPTSFSLAQLADLALAHTKLYGTRVFSTGEWGGYVQAALTYMLCPRFEGAAALRESLGLSASSMSCEDRASHTPPRVGLRFFVCSPGRLRLSHAGGVSSSAALTGAISMSLLALFPPTPSTQGTEWMLARRDVLASVDYGEYFLGKHAGAADKMAQLHARRGCVTVIQALPECLRRTVEFPPPSLMRTLVCTAPIPRLTMPSLARPFLLQERGYTPEHAQRVEEWAGEVMASFGSTAFVQAVEVLRAALADPQAVARVGLQAEEAEMLARALVTHPPLEYTQPPASSPLSSAADTPPPPTPCSYKLGLLRELCHGGSLDSIMWEAASAASSSNASSASSASSSSSSSSSFSSLTAWSDRHRRYRLLYRCLKLLPELYVYAPAPPSATSVTASSSSSALPRAQLLHLRKAALYGLAEVERGAEYLICMDDIADIQRALARQADEGKAAAVTPSTTAPSPTSPTPSDLSRRLQCRLQRVLQLCALAHDGDRAVVDYRKLRGVDDVPSVESLLRHAVVSPHAASLPPPACTSRLFHPTPWAADPRNDCSDEQVDRWIAAVEADIAAGNTAESDTADLAEGESSRLSSASPAVQAQKLADLPGGFERGLIDIDEMADTLNQLFRRISAPPSASAAAAASSSSSSCPPVSASPSVPLLPPAAVAAAGASLRISAAGLGGRVCVHALSECADDVAHHLRGQGWDVRYPLPSAPTQTITLS